MKKQAFFITVDSKQYGPFFNEDDDNIKRLKHMKGVEVEYTLVEEELLPPKKRKQKPVNLSLLDGMPDWIPRRRGR